ncbi:DUF1677 family protein (DUF1677) isoform X2 [Tasmannia lanceolata]|uniref:DUF1677 family protein (DUF1677) isoform X2 n=1 Tax=Tasmannia lanceolata TaxID=3420 RepID=UPI0040643CF2
MAISCPESQSAATKMNGQIEVELANCDCCGVTEECTQAYIETVRERYHGRWICGLCSEAVKYEIFRSENHLDMEEALNNQKNLCKKFRSSTPKDSMEHVISAIKHLLRRSLSSPRSTPTSPSRKPILYKILSLVKDSTEWNCRNQLQLLDLFFSRLGIYKQKSPEVPGGKEVH